VVALVLRGAPLSLTPHTVAAAERDEAERDLPPLPDGPRRPEADVVVITIDALRADHVGAYGYKRPTTPNIDALAARSTRFARAYTQAPHTSFSVASMLTGKYFPTLARLAPGEIHDPIAGVLRKYGWRTAAFYPPSVFFVDAPKLKAYADTNFSFEYVKFEYIDAERRVDQMIHYYETVKPSKAMVWVHFFEPHEPYDIHPGFRFGASDIDRYDSEIAYVDAAVGRLLAYVKKHRPGAIVVISADHGEEFDEHGGRYHGSTLYEEQVRIPLVISIPDAPPRVIQNAVELIDVTPTILNLLDIPVPARMRGTDLGPWLAEPPAAADRLPAAFAEVEDKRMVVWRDEKLICDLNWGFCAYYDLAQDPGERKNLADIHPDRAAALRTMLDDWLDGHVRLEPLLARGASNPLGGPVPKAIERGRLGDLLAAEDLGALMVSSAPVELRREAAELLIALPPRRETAPVLARAVRDHDQVIADWAAVGAVRLGDVVARARVRALVDDVKAERMLRIRGALALAAIDEAAGVPVLGEALDRCDDILLCRLIILNLGRLRDRRAVPALLKHLPEVQNRREMVDALGDIGDIGDITARDALIERLGSDEYVTVRIQAARALAKLGDMTAIAALERAASTDPEPTVAAAARAAVAAVNQLHP
jgi:arylsulfatase A-like enzyme